MTLIRRWLFRLWLWLGRWLGVKQDGKPATPAEAKQGKCLIRIHRYSDGTEKQVHSLCDGVPQNGSPYGRKLVGQPDNVWWHNEKKIGIQVIPRTMNTWFGKRDDAMRPSYYISQPDSRIDKFTFVVPDKQAITVDSLQEAKALGAAVGPLESDRPVSRKDNVEIPYHGPVLVETETKTHYV